MAKKKDKATSAEAKATTGASLAAHPRARAGIRRTRTRAATAAFVLVLVLNVLGDQGAFDAIWRALLAGIVVNVIAWRCAIVVWRHVVISELRLAEEQYAERRRVAAERLAEQAKSSGFNPA